MSALNPLTLRNAFESSKIVPYQNIIKGEITENSFAVGFGAVLNGTADKIYQDPQTFFNLTHMTTNLRGIFTDVLTRVSKGESRPFIVIDTAFGGGKTHTLVGIYHLFTSSNKVKTNSDIQAILKDVGLSEIPEVSLVSIDCHNLSSVKRKGAVRTIWGEIARQLNCYDLMETFDQDLRRPVAGDLSKVIRSSKKPVLILIDELVNYLKDSKAEKVGDQNLAEITASFFHTLTDVISNERNAMLIITLPGTESVYKEESELLEQYKKYIKELSGRQSPFTVPMDKEEIYKVITKRLFESVDDTYARQVAEGLQKFYAQNSENFPEDVLSTRYYEKIVNSYPFHPQLVDMLYERVSTISEFQKTRGVLRLVSHILKNVYKNIDQIPYDSIITTGLIDLNDKNILQELTNKIAQGQFESVIKTDIVNEESEAKCQKLDSKKRYGPEVRLATSVYLYTLIGTTREISVGGSLKELTLATSVDGVTYPKDIPNDATTLENNLWYVYNRNGKLYYNVQANIIKIIAEETERISKIEFDQEIKSRLRKMLSSDYFDVYIWEHDIRSPHKPTLVVVNYNDIKGTESTVPNTVKDIIEKEGTSFRTKKNYMFVLVPREDRIIKMVEASKRYLAIKQIKSTAKSREDIKSYASKIDELFKENESTLNASIELCYSLIYYPHRTEIKCITVLDGYEGAKNVPDKVYRALVDKARKIIEKLSPDYIADKIIQGKDEITVGEIWSDFESSPAHPLLSKKQVLYDAISFGINDGQFGLYAGGIGDLLSITPSNFKEVGLNYYYKRIISEPKEANYIIPKQRAISIENRLNELSKVGEKIPPGSRPGPEPKTKNVKIDNIAKLCEYKDWVIKEIDFNFDDTRILYNLKDKLPLLMLGISNLKYSIDIKSNKLSLSVKQTEVTDFNSTLDVLYKISSMFPEGYNSTISIFCLDNWKVDSDVINSIKGFEVLHDQLLFSASLEKSGA